MSKKSKRNRKSVEPLDLKQPESSIASTVDIKVPSEKAKNLWLYRRVHWLAAFVLSVLVTLGIFASNGWLPHTDPITGKKTGWFGKELPKNVSSSWNPLAPPLPTPTPQLAREYLYAGSRLLNVIDSGAQEAPPADLAIWRPSTGEWWVLGGPGSQQTNFTWGVSTDRPVPGDYDGDGKTDFSVFRPSTGEWYVVNSSNGSWSVWQWGLSTDVTAPADYDGDGKTDRAVWRPSTAAWYIIRSSDGAWMTPTFGLSSDVPAPADYDGDGKADIGVWRNSNTTFYSLNTADNSFQTIPFSQSSTEPVSGDYDGDGKADYAVKSGNSWIIRKSSNVQTENITWEQAGDKPVQNDYDGDGKVDIATWRDSNGNWYIRQSGSGNSLRQVWWGQSGDTPVPAFYRR